MRSYYSGWRHQVARDPSDRPDRRVAPDGRTYERIIVEGARHAGIVLAREVVNGVVARDARTLYPFEKEWFGWKDVTAK